MTTRNTHFTDDRHSAGSPQSEGSLFEYMRPLPTVGPKLVFFVRAWPSHVATVAISARFCPLRAVSHLRNRHNKPFRMRSCATISKKTTYKTRRICKSRNPFRMRTYEKAHFVKRSVGSDQIESHCGSALPARQYVCVLHFGCAWSCAGASHVEDRFAHAVDP